MKPTDAENTIKKLKYPKHLRHLSIERLEILAKIFTPRGGWMMSRIYKIRYKDTMTTYQLSASFNTREEAEEYINLNLGEDSLYEVEVNDEN